MFSFGLLKLQAFTEIYLKHVLQEEEISRVITCTCEDIIEDYGAENEPKYRTEIGAPLYLINFVL